MAVERTAMAEVGMATVAVAMAVVVRAAAEQVVVVTVVVKEVALTVGSAREVGQTQTM